MRGKKKRYYCAIQEALLASLQVFAFVCLTVTRAAVGSVLCTCMAIIVGLYLQKLISLNDPITEE